MLIQNFGRTSIIVFFKNGLASISLLHSPFLESSRNAPRQECCITKTENNERGGELNSGGYIP